MPRNLAHTQNEQIEIYIKDTRLRKQHIPRDKPQMSATSALQQNIPIDDAFVCITPHIRIRTTIIYLHFQQNNAR